MSNDDKKEELLAVEKTEHGSLVNGNEGLDRLFLEYSQRDDEWKAFQNKKLLRKIDLRLLPFLTMMYLFNSLDRSNLAQARLGSLEADLVMTGTDFNLATSILFVGYLLMQLPSNLIITRVRPSLYLGGVMTVWGIVSAAQGSVKSFGGLLACRIMLGVAEAPFFPGVIMLMSSWYRRDELAHRISWFYSGVALANMFGGLVGAGVLSHLDGAHGVAGWRWLFIIEGSITIGIALASTLVLPNWPQDSKWLTDEERSYAQWRMADDANESDDVASTTIWTGLKLAIKDYRIYLFILLQHISLLSQSFQYFFPSIVKTLGYSQTTTLLLTVPVWFATFLIALLATYSSSKTGERSLHITTLMLISSIGNIIATVTTGTGPRFFAMFLMPIGAVSAYQIIVTWIANSFPRPTVKRAASIAICNMLGNTATIYGSYMYPEDDSPRFLAGGSANACVCFVVALVALVLRFVLVRENKKLDEAEVGDDEVAVGVIGQAGSAAGFRYIT